MNYKQRTDAIKTLMDSEGIDWFFVTHPTNVRYLSGFTGSHGVLMTGREECHILTDGRYQEQVALEVRDYRPVIQGTRKELEAMKESLGDLSRCRVGFESEYCSVDRWEEMQKTLPAKSYVGKKGVVESLRAIKDEREIGAIRRALRTAETAIQKSLAHIREGMMERELAHRIEDEMWKEGAEKESFESLVLFGARSSLCHGRPSDYRLKRGEPVLMDVGCVVDGYCSDITRTVFLGAPNEEFKNIYEAVRRANLAAEEQIRAGVGGKEADTFAREVIQKLGFGELFVHGLGHGVGLEIHEAPRLSPLADQNLQAGNVVTVEPGIYRPGFGGVRIEDMIVVRPNGCEVLTQLDKNLITI